jgi:hypothetical protein
METGARLIFRVIPSLESFSGPSHGIIPNVQIVAKMPVASGLYW